MLTLAPLPYRRADWLAARAALASRRNARLAVTTFVAFLFVLGTLLFVSDAWRSLRTALPGASPMTGPAAGVSATPLAGMIAAALIVGLLLGYALNLTREIARPRLAGPEEAERVAGAPVIAVITAGASFDTTDAIDPYRLAYLSVSSAGARAHSIIVTGDDRALVTTIAARIARAAAADARATLVLDLDVEHSPVSRYYGIRSEAGFMDAIVGVRLWREVAVPMGANEGLAIDVVPAGARRRDVPEPPATREFEEFVHEHDFCVLVAPGERAFRRACVVLPSPAALLCAREELSTLSSLSSWRTRLHANGAFLRGIVVWSDKRRRHIT
ncbi:MAG: hypothetical protein HY059_07165 [Proteobacteria bacterium]|nr:hypothetical protein [Pseudomonadota bacterium]